MSIEVEIVPGYVRVNEVTHLIDHPDVYVFEVDLASKYPGQPQWVSNRAGDGMDVYLLDSPDSLNLDATADATTIVRLIGFDADKFTGITEATRYTARIAFYRSHP